MVLRKQLLRKRRKKRIRFSVRGTSARPRLSVFRSNRSFSAQLIDDERGETIASAFLREGGIEGAKKVASILADKYKGECVFDRNGFLYHGRVKAFADKARSLGINF